MRRALLTLTLATLATGCASVNMPNLPDIGAQFRSDVADIPDMPRLSQAPVAAGDDRSAAAWDAAARGLVAERAALDVPPAVDTASPAEIERDIEALKARVRAYRLDDPQ